MPFLKAFEELARLRVWLFLYLKQRGRYAQKDSKFPATNLEALIKGFFIIKI